MLTVFTSLAFLLALGVAAAALAAIALDDADKILAALAGRSFLSRENSVRPVTVRFSPRYPARDQRPVRALPELRAAA
jgi:hypothetical protein